MLPPAFEIGANTISEPKAGLTFTFDHVANQNAPQVISRLTRSNIEAPLKP